MAAKQEISKVSRTDVRFRVDPAARYPSARAIHAVLLEQGWTATPVNEDDGEAAIDEAAALDLRRSIWRFLFVSAILTIPVLVLAWSGGFESQFPLRGGIALGSRVIGPDFLCWSHHSRRRTRSHH